MKFLADMGISPQTVTFLRILKHDAVHLHEQGLHKLADPDILAKATNEERVLLTHDLGFGELVAASGAKLSCVIIFRLRNMHPENVNRYLKQVIKEHQESIEQGSIISVAEGQVRVRHLPFLPDS